MFLRLLLAVALLMVGVFTTRACEVCGCTIGAPQFGILPQFNKHLVGARTSYRSFFSDHGGTSRDANEAFYTTEIWGRYALSKDWQIFAFIPYQWSQKEEQYGTFASSGIGDISFVAMYSLINQKASTSGSFIHNLQVGMGIKLPTGSTDYINEYEQWYPGLQNGSGSLDVLLNASYVLRMSEWGAAAEATYRINGSNSEYDFAFGDRTSVTLRGLYVHSVDRWSVVPTVGLLAEFANEDEYQSEAVEPSGGHSFFAHLGVDFFADNFGVGMTYQPTLSENIADTFIQSRSRVTLTFSLFL